MNQINPYRHGGEALTFDGFGNRSRSFDGVDDYVNLGQTTDNAIFTASTWLKLKTHDNSAGEGVFGKWQTSAAGSWLIYVDAGATPNIKFIVRNGTNNTNYICDSGISASSIIGDWTHIAGVADGTNLTIYVNGVSEGSIAYNGTINNPTTAIFIGAYNNTINNLHFTDGNIADCRLYNIALTATEISDIYNGTNITTNLVGHWLTDSDNVLDAAGTNHGTNYGTKYSYDNPSPPVEFGSASRIFNGTSDRVTIAAAPVDDEPITMAAWVKLDTTTQVGGIWNIEGDSGSGNTGFGLLMVNGVLWAYSQEVGAFDYAASTSTLNTTDWWHVCGVFRSSTDREIYINGTSEGTNTTSVSPNVVDIDNACIGNRANTNNDQDFSGKIADVRVYDADIGATEIANLAAGTDVQTNLVGHWLTDNDDVEDKAGTNDGTNFGSTYSYDNPPMDLIPFGQKSRSFASDFVNTNTGFQSVFQSSFSISTWVRFDNGIPSSSEIIFGNQSAAPISRVLIFLDNAGALTFGYFSNGNQSRAEIDQNFANGDTGWFHYTAVVEPTGITIYKDGSVQTLDATDDGDMSAVTMGDYGTDIDCYIGARNLNGTTDLSMTGNIADFRIYDSALSASDVAKIYNRTDDKSNIYAWYLTNSDDVLDHAGTNDGTNNGSTYSNDSPS